RIARHRAFHKERTGFRIAAHRTLGFRGIAPTRVHRGGADGIAGIDVQRGRYVAGELAVEFLRLEGAGLGSGSGKGRPPASDPLDIVFADAATPGEVVAVDAAL